MNRRMRRVQAAIERMQAKARAGKDKDPQVNAELASAATQAAVETIAEEMEALTAASAARMGGIGSFDQPLSSRLDDAIRDQNGTAADIESLCNPGNSSTSAGPSRSIFPRRRIFSQPTDGTPTTATLRCAARTLPIGRAVASRP